MLRAEIWWSQFGLRLLFLISQAFVLYMRQRYPACASYRLLQAWATRQTPHRSLIDKKIRDIRDWMAKKRFFVLTCPFTWSKTISCQVICSLRKSFMFSFSESSQLLAAHFVEIWNHGFNLKFFCLRFFAQRFINFLQTLLAHAHPHFWRTHSF